MDKINLLVIAPYKGMNRIINELLSEREDVTADYYVANLKEVHTLLAELNIFEYDAVISRGGTARLIESLVNLPVYDVGLSALDALRAIRLAQNFNQKMAIIGFENITQTMHTICEVLQWDYPIVTIYHEEEAQPRLLELKTAGYSVVVCDVISSIAAPSLGMNAVLSTSGYETIETALTQAIRLTKGHVRSRQELLHLTLSYQNNPYSCIILDDDGKIISSSLDIKDSNHILPYIKEHLSELRMEEAPEFERPFRGGVLSFLQQQHFLKNKQYFYLYVRFHERTESQRINAIRMRSGIKNENMDFTYYNSSHYQSNTQDLIEKYGRSLSPVILSGEEGTGKDQAAYLIHCCSSYQSSVFYQIDCESATGRNWTYLFTHHESPLMHNKHTLYFRHVNQLSDSTFYKLLSVIMDTNLVQRNRLIFSFVEKKNSPHSHEYMSQLMQRTRCLFLRIPALRERPGDIPYLCTHYINQLNTRLGKQIVGFDAKALRALTTFAWETNLAQFQRIIEELMLVTNSSYISFENTMRQLSQESALWTSESAVGYQFNLDQPLEDINYDIARQVLKEENGNHSRTAERLGISRSTLWRMLKKH